RRERALYHRRSQPVSHSHETFRVVDADRGGVMASRRLRIVQAAVLLLALRAGAVVSSAGQSGAGPAQVPQFEFDPTWPEQPFPNYEIIGNVIGLAIDAKEHIWVLHRPQMVTEQEQGAAFGLPEALCCRPAKPVIEIDQTGAVVQSWGGPGP